MDYIHLNKMQFYSYHGALKEENVLGQRFNVSLSIATDLKEAGQTDNLATTINYALVYEICKKVIEGETALLIEALAERIAQQILTTFPERAKGVRVTLVKPDPPIAGIYESVAVEVTRGIFV